MIIFLFEVHYLIQITIFFRFLKKQCEMTIIYNIVEFHCGWTVLRSASCEIAWEMLVYFAVFLITIKFEVSAPRGGGPVLHIHSTETRIYPTLISG